MEKVIYVERKEGTYQGYNYNNYIIHCVGEQVNNDKAKGQKVEIYKLKAKDVEKLNPFLWLGKKVEISFDKYGNPMNVNLSD